MPDDRLPTAHVSLRAPIELVNAFDRIAKVLDRDRSWVMLRALRNYLDQEGREILEDAQALRELGEGAALPFAKVIDEARQIVRAKTRRRHTERR